MNNRILNFKSWNSLNESAIYSDLKMVYLFTHGDRFSFSHIDSLVRSASENMFEILMPPGIFPDIINRNLPVYNYGNKQELQDLINSGHINTAHVYNLPENLKYANDKVEFHKATKELSFVPNTVFTKDETTKLKFPVIGKPKGGSKGEGILVFKTKEELDKDKSELDLYSEKFDLDREFRVISVNGNLVFIAERLPMNDKANSLREGEDIFDKDGTISNRSSYKWENVKYGEHGIPNQEEFKKMAKSINDALKLEILGIDFGLDTAGKLFVIEANTCPGLNKDQIIQIYIAVFNDFYGYMPNASTMKKIEELRGLLLTANEDPAKFSYSATMGRRMDWSYEEDGRKTSTVKFDIEKSFGMPLTDIKRINQK